MATIHWASAVSGDFDSAADWAGGAIPGASDDAVLDAPGAAYTVTADQGFAVDSLQTAANATLDIEPPRTQGSYSVAVGTGSGANLGTIEIDTDLNVGGGLDNPGLITLSGGTLGMVSSLSISGHGQVIGREPEAGGAIFANTSGLTLTNVDNRVAGVEFAGFAQVINEAQGIIKSNAAGAGIFSPLQNAGWLKAGIDSVFLVIANIDNGSSGMMLAKDGGYIDLGQVTISGGTLESQGSGVMTTSGATTATIDGTANAFTNDGLLAIAPNSPLTLRGSIIDNGTIVFEPGQPQPTDLNIDNVTLTGAGALDLLFIEYSHVVGVSSTSTLSNGITIQGGGRLGQGRLVLTNTASGVIDGNSTMGSLVIRTSSAIQNDGVIEASAGGATRINSAVVNDGLLEANGGFISARRAVSGAGSVQIVSGQAEFFSSFAQNVAFTGTSGELILGQSQAYTGTISGFSTSGGTSLDLSDVAFVDAGEASFSGNASGGVLTVSDGTHTAQIHLAGDYLGSTFAASSDGAGGTVVTDPRAAAFAQHIAAALAMPALAVALRARPEVARLPRLAARD